MGTIEDLNVEMCHYGINYGGGGVKSSAESVTCPPV
jgi:hypothetical protein